MVVLVVLNVSSKTVDVRFSFYTSDGGQRMPVFVFEEHVKICSRENRMCFFGKFM